MIGVEPISDDVLGQLSSRRPYRIPGWYFLEDEPVRQFLHGLVVFVVANILLVSAFVFAAVVVRGLIQAQKSPDESGPKFL